MLRWSAVERSRPDHDVLPTRSLERPLHLQVLGYFQPWRSHWRSGEYSIHSLPGNIIVADIIEQVPLGENIDVTSNAPVNDGTYIGFLVFTFVGACLAWTLVDAKHIVCSDGSRVILQRNPTWKSEILGLWETLFTDPYILFLFPMFFASNWFYTYQFNVVNFAKFNTRTRALNNVLYWIAQIIGVSIFGFALDYSRLRRTTRAAIAWVVMFALTFAVWGGSYKFQPSIHPQGYARLW